MHISAQLLPAYVALLCAALCAIAVITAVFTADWGALRSQPRRVHLVAGGALACLLLWLMNIHLVQGLTLHFLGMTTLTLLVGWSFTVLGACVSLAGFYLLQGMDWSMFGVSALLTVLLPASTSRLLARLLYRPGLRHPFIYFLGAGFAGGGLVVLCLAVVSVALLQLGGQAVMVEDALSWWPLLFLIMFSEAFINGMCVSALAVFAPEWMKTFDDRFYLGDE